MADILIVVKDGTTGLAMQGVQLELLDAGGTKIQTTLTAPDGAGFLSSGAGLGKYIVRASASGYTSGEQNIDITGYWDSKNLYFLLSRAALPPSTPLPPPPVPTPLPPVVTDKYTVGTACDIQHRYEYGQPWYRYRNRVTGLISNWDSSEGDALQAAYGDPGCFVPPPPLLPPLPPLPPPLPPPTGPTEGRVREIVNEIVEWTKKVVSNLLERMTEVEGSINAMGERISSEAAAWRAGLATAKTAIEGTIAAEAAAWRAGVSAAKTAIEGAIATEAAAWRAGVSAAKTAIEGAIATEAAAWRAGVKALDIDIRAWIEAEIVAILIRAFDREAEKAGK